MFIYTSTCEKLVVFEPSWTLFIVHALKSKKTLPNYLRFGFWGCFICRFADELIGRQESYTGLCGKCVFAAIIDLAFKLQQIALDHDSVSLAGVL